VSQSNLEFSLRDVTQSDESLLLDWANDSEVRRWRWKNTIKIKQSEHRKWLRKKLADENTRIWIMQSWGVSCGFVRIEVERNIAILHYSISAKHRGQNYGSRMLCLAAEKVRSEYGGLTIIAHTFPGNIASQKTLEKAGFRKDAASSNDQCVSYILFGESRKNF